MEFKKINLGFGNFGNGILKINLGFRKFWKIFKWNLKN